MPVLALAIFAAVFAIATLRNVHLGVLMLPAACAVGVFLAGMPLKDVIAGFPVSLMLLLAGVTYFFSAWRKATARSIVYWSACCPQWVPGAEYCRSCSTWRRPSWRRWDPLKPDMC